MLKNAFIRVPKLKNLNSKKCYPYITYQNSRLLAHFMFRNFQSSFLVTSKRHVVELPSFLPQWEETKPIFSVSYDWLFFLRGGLYRKHHPSFVVNAGAKPLPAFFKTKALLKRDLRRYKTARMRLLLFLPLTRRYAVLS